MMICEQGSQKFFSLLLQSLVDILFLMELKWSFFPYIFEFETPVLMDLNEMSENGRKLSRFIRIGSTRYGFFCPQFRAEVHNSNLMAGQINFFDTSKGQI